MFLILLSILIGAAAAAAAAAVSVQIWILLRRQAKLKEMNRAIGCINPRTWRRRGKGGIPTSIDSLPDDLLFNILVRLPAHDIHRNARLVCRRWKLLVHGDAFVGAHLHRTGYGLLFCYSPNYSGLGNYIFGSCNGLVLGTKYSKQDSNHSIYVANPATNQVFDLPRFLVESDFEEGAFHRFCRFGIAYAAASAKYKVVAVYNVLSGSDICFTVECLRYAILTVGVDTAWREIAIDQLSPLAENILCGFFHILTTEGYLHWVPLHGKHVLTMDVETEKIVETPPPYEYKKNPSNIYLSTGSYLTLLINHDNFMWEVWEMKGGSGEWREVVPDIDLNAHVSELPRLGFDDEDYNLTPIGWVKYPEVLLFIPFDRRYHKTDSRGLITYNLEGDEINFVKLPVKSKYFEALVHKNSLVWWC